MRSIVYQYKFQLLLLIIFVLAELIVNPIGNFPLNDDWTYSKSVLIFQNEGKINIGSFAAMSLFTHIIWGFVFTKVFWFSHTILRFSIIVSSFIGVLTLNKLIVRISGNHMSGFIGSLVLLFNPIYFNLSNTFMTDVNFNTLLVVGCYFAFDFFQTKKVSSFLIVFLISCFLILMRQFGIILPVCFVLACLFLSEKKIQYTLAGLILAFVAFVVLTYYESYLKTILDPHAAYKFSSKNHFFTMNFWQTFWNNCNLRFLQVVLNLLVYATPFICIFFWQLAKKNNLFLISIIFLLNASLVYLVFRNVSLLSGNVFTNLSLGAETFYETLFFDLKSPNEHTYSQKFAEFLDIITFLFCTCSLTVMILMLQDIKLATHKFLQINPVFAFFILLLMAYIFMLMMTESYFDRYYIPIVSITILIFSFVSKRIEIYPAASFLLVAFFCFLSLLGTKDYLELNRKRWEAFNYLKETEKVNIDRINGGFEINCWNEGKQTWWTDFFNINNFDYLIQYRQEPDFKIYKEIRFKRYLTLKEEKLYIFKRVEKIE